MKQLYYLLAIAACAALPLAPQAAPLSPEASLQLALGSGPAQAPSTAGWRLVYSTPGIYVFNSAAGGFVVTSADTAGAPLLGYSDNGAFDPDNIPVNMLSVLDAYTDAITDAASDGTEYTPGDAADDRAEIKPLVETLWGQEAPYNNLCPAIGSERCPTGCVATAMAQVMRFWSYPEKGHGTHSYVWDNQTLTHDFGADTYAWADMPLEYNDASTAAQNSAVATLMLACGIASDMEYGTNGSGTNYYYAAEGMVNYFTYDPGMTCLEREFFTAADWEEKMYDELAAGRPVLYSGANSHSGHAFVCDGYQAGSYFHINWGWNGMANGYFLLDALNPSQQGTGGSSSGYNSNQLVIIGIQPPTGRTSIVPMMRCYGEFTTGASTYTAADRVRFVFEPYGSDPNGGIFSSSIGEISAMVGVKLTPLSRAASDPIYVASPAGTVSLGVNNGFSGYALAGSDLPAEGSYAVSPAFSVDGKWYDAMEKPDVPSRLRLTASNGNLNFDTLTDSPTGIESVVYEPADSRVDVYSITGIRLRSNVDRASAAQDLPAGIYIIGDRKVAVR